MSPARRREKAQARPRGMVTLFLRGFAPEAIATLYDVSPDRVLDVIREAFDWPRAVLRNLPVEAE